MSHRFIISGGSSSSSSSGGSGSSSSSSDHRPSLLQDPIAAVHCTLHAAPLWLSSSHCLRHILGLSL
ncbi:MAG: hypothetical protein WDW38_001570 [Sanguina aurantia]